MQPPPPTGCTGTAPPGAGGATDEEAIAAGAAPEERPAAKTNALTHPHSAARAFAFEVPIRHNSSCSAVDARVTRENYEHTPRILQGVTHRVASPRRSWDR